MAGVSAREAAARFANDEALRYYAQALELASGGSSAGGTTPDGQYAGEYDDLLFERALAPGDRGLCTDTRMQTLTRWWGRGG